VSMAFAYPSLEEGTLGRDRGVEVIDEPARVSASIGLRGSLSLDRAVVSAEAVRHWTREHLTGWRVCDGAVNVAGWNSPFVAASCRAWEVQIRIEPGTGLEAGRTT
jgi:hypothetical protein